MDLNDEELEFTKKRKQKEKRIKLIKYLEEILETNYLLNSDAREAIQEAIEYFKKEI